MKIRTKCRQCTTVYVDELPLIEIQDEDIYEFKCDRGHENVLWLQNHKFEILFDSACLALLDGYPREAVFSLASSLERFLEFTVRVLSLHLGIPSDKLEEAWRWVARQSERQLGMFFCVWLLHTKQSPGYLEDRWIAFRNGVVHAGKVPPRTEVIAYGDRVLSFIVEHLDVIKRDASKAIHDLNMTRWMKAMKAKEAYPDLVMFTQHIPMIVSVAVEEPRRSFIEAVEKVKTRRQRIYGT